MERSAHFSGELKKYIGKQVSKEILLGRNYYFVEDQKVKEDLCLDEIQDLDLSDSTDYKQFYESYSYVEDCDDEDEDEDYDYDCEEDEISCAKVKAYLAAKTSQGGWFKCIPSHPADVQVGSAYIIIRLNVDADFKITSVHTFVRFMDNVGSCAGFIIMPHTETMDCHIEHMPMFPPEVLDELDNLIKGRHYYDGMSLIGKPLPTEIDYMNGCDDSKTLAKCSSFRNSYWHASIDLDADGLIDYISFSCWGNESSMFTRPSSSSEDIIDGLDCMLTLLDAYTDEEYNRLFEL